jgi:hypothetical protein
LACEKAAVKASNVRIVVRRRVLSFMYFTVWNVGPGNQS